MSDVNKTFFNEYAKLDKLCCGIYSKLPREQIKGVTNYIEDMRSTPPGISKNISDWDNCLHTLVHLRHMRNHLAHEPDAFNRPLCTNTDIDNIHYIYESILAGTDPLSRINQRGKHNKHLTETHQKTMLTKPPKRILKRTIRSIVKLFLRKL